MPPRGFLLRSTPRKPHPCWLPWVPPRVQPQPPPPQAPGCGPKPPADVEAGSGSTNPLDRVEALIRCTDDPRLVQWICQRAGGFFILNPKTNKPHPSYLIPATNEIVQEFADLLAVIATAAADNQITQKEANQIRARWEELKSVTESFVACCEEGNFLPLKEKQPLKTGEGR